MGVGRRALGILERARDRVRKAVRRRSAIDWFERGVLALIIVNTAGVMLGTVDALDRRYGDVFIAIEYGALAAFTIEFLIRVGARIIEGSGDTRRADRLLDPYLAIDLLAILPAYVGLAHGATDLGSSSLVRVLRLFKLARYFDGLELLMRVVRRKRADLAASVLWTGVLWVIAASSIYYAEAEAQPEAFSSIPEALWWAGVTITTVGYGDVYPVTPLGRVLGVVVSLLGIGIAAVPSSILVSGFLEETGPDAAVCPQCGDRMDDE